VAQPARFAGRRYRCLPFAFLIASSWRVLDSLAGPSGRDRPSAAVLLPLHWFHSPPTFGARWPGAWLYGHFGIRFVFSWTARPGVGSHHFPLQVRAIRLALSKADRDFPLPLRRSAPRLRRLINITVRWRSGSCRVSSPRLLSLGEFGAIITFVSNIPGETRTLPLAIYAALQAPGAISRPHVSRRYRSLWR